MIAWYRKDPSRLSEIKMALLEDKVVQAIIARAEPVAEQVAISDLLPSENAVNQPRGIERLES